MLLVTSLLCWSWDISIHVDGEHAKCRRWAARVGGTPDQRDETSCRAPERQQQPWADTSSAPSGVCDREDTAGTTAGSHTFKHAWQRTVKQHGISQILCFSVWNELQWHQRRLNRSISDGCSHTMFVLKRRFTLQYRYFFPLCAVSRSWVLVKIAQI